MSEKQKRKMRRAVRRFQEFIKTYSDQAGYEHYSDRIFLDDMLYGIGVALDPTRHEWASGYEVFKDRLRKHLTPPKPERLK